MTAAPLPRDEQQRDRARRLGLYGLLARWDEFGALPWVAQLLDCEENGRQQRSLERRIRRAKLGRFKLMADFDRSWPAGVDLEEVDDLFSFRFVGEAANVILAGPNGVGKTMIAQNLAHQALLRGYTVQFTTASAMLNDLAAQEGAASLARRLKRYCQPQLLVVDELGYLSYGNHHADLLFEVVSQRYQKRSIVLTTNKPFAEWSEVFPSAACVATLIDRLVHRSEIFQIEGNSYRYKEAQEREAEKKAKRRTRKERKADQ
jgi:DNA replication protein DnaC